MFGLYTLTSLAGIVLIALGLGIRIARRISLRQFASAVFLLGGAALLTYGTLAQMREPDPPKPRRPRSALFTVCPLETRELPGSRQQFLTQIERGIHRILDVPDGRAVLHLAGDTYPRMGDLRVDLSDASVNPDKRFPKSAGVPAGEAWASVARIDLVARPFIYQQAHVDVAISGADAHFRAELDRNARPVLVVDEIYDGRARAAVRIDEIEAVLLTAVQKEASAHDIIVDKTHINVKTENDRTAYVQIGITARRSFVKATARAWGRVDIDDQFSARISGLGCEGEGVVGRLIAALIRPLMEPYEGYQKQLDKALWGDVKLRDLRLRTDEQDRLLIEAAFGDHR